MNSTKLGLTLVEKLRVKQLFCGTLPTGEALARWGFKYNSVCYRCGMLDSAWHRVWSCPCPRASAVRSEVFPEALIQQALEAGPGSLLFSRAWVARPDLSTEPPAQDWVQDLKFFGPGGEEIL
eukprot:3668997-Pyramimonas_sp.AAC.1